MRCRLFEIPEIQSFVLECAVVLLVDVLNTLRRPLLLACPVRTFGAHRVFQSSQGLVVNMKAQMESISAPIRHPSSTSTREMKMFSLSPIH
ncbi:hypothetical protein DPEC_G00183990 [Dallia pectoralis]|uniref:Uncharacterized protein n=1 Tax=Dallia pectoralis TaxID=75939 RepID=A0ACC2GB10_DALPE|nr:hypothetical protein DPEC_G00183990 [Dallia pectoralis]